MNVELVEKSELWLKKPTSKYAEAIKLLAEGKKGTTIRIVEESNFAAKKAICCIRQHMNNRGMNVTAHYWQNIAEIERL